jgi:hypothetical protein
MADAVTFADEGNRLCDANRDDIAIQPGDCALLRLIDPVIAHDRAAIAFRAMNVANLPARRTALLAPAAGVTTPPDEGRTQLGVVMQQAFEGWLRLQAVSPSLCRAEIDGSVRDYARILNADMTANLGRVYAAMNETLEFGRGYQDGAYGAACAEERDGARLTGVAIRPVEGRNDLADRANRFAWCRWKAAERNAAPVCAAGP